MNEVLNDSFYLESNRINVHSMRYILVQQAAVTSLSLCLKLKLISQFNIYFEHFIANEMKNKTE